MFIILNRHNFFITCTIIHQFFSISRNCSILIHNGFSYNFNWLTIFINNLSIYFFTLFFFSIRPIFYCMFLSKMFTILISMLFSTRISIRFINLKEIRILRFFLVKFFSRFKLVTIIRIEIWSLLIILLSKIRIWKYLIGFC